MIPVTTIFQLDYDVLTREIGGYLEDAGLIAAEDGVGILQEDYQKIPEGGSCSVSKRDLRDPSVLKEFSYGALWAREVCSKRMLEDSKIPARMAKNPDGMVHYFRASDILGYLAFWGLLPLDSYLKGVSYSIRR